MVKGGRVQTEDGNKGLPVDWGGLRVVGMGVKRMAVAGFVGIGPSVRVQRSGFGSVCSRRRSGVGLGVYIRDRKEVRKEGEVKSGEGVEQARSAPTENGFEEEFVNGNGLNEERLRGEAVEELVLPELEEAKEITKDDVDISEVKVEEGGPVNGFDYLWPRIMLLVVAAVWGTNFAIVKLLDESMRSSASATGRFVLAALALSPAMIGQSREVLSRGLNIGIFVFAGYFLQANALRDSSSNKIAFLCSLAVVFVPLFDKLLPSKETVHEVKKSVPLLSILLAVGGVGLLELSSEAQPTFGDFLGLLQAGAFASGFVLNERAMSKYPESALALSAAQLASVGGLSVVWYILDSSILYGNFDLQGITVAFSDPLTFGSLLYTGLITTAMAVVLETFALKRVSAGELSILLSTEPFFAAAFSAFFLDESLGTKGIIGGVFIIAACLSDQITGALKKPREAITKWLKRSKQS